MIEGFNNIQHANLGIDSGNVATMRVQLLESKYKERFQRTAFFDDAVSKVKALPGVESVGLAGFLPASNNWNRIPFSVEGHPVLNQADLQRVNRVVVGAEYFKTLRIPLLKGRVFSESDGSDSPRTVVISDEMAKRFWPNQIRSDSMCVSNLLRRRAIG